MDRYLKGFMEKLSKRWEGGLVKVNFVRHKNAKEYMNKLANKGKIERVIWGWYYIPDKSKTSLDFLRSDRNFKVLAGQTAASFWNGDFIHRNAYFIVVEDKFYKKALEAFAAKRGWNFKVDFNKNAKREIEFASRNGLNIEKPAESAALCMQNWAFADAFSIIFSNKNARAELKDFYWRRVSGTNVRIGQVMSYAISHREAAKIPEIMKEDIDESIEKVREFA